MLAQIVALEDDAGRVGEPLCSNPAAGVVDAENAPAVAVADLVNLLTRRWCVAGSTVRLASLRRLRIRSPARTC